jgi:hypothetical protein
MIQKKDQMLSNVLAELEHIAFTGMSKFLTVDGQNQVKIDLTNCTPKELDQVAEIQMTIRKVPGTREYETISFSLKMKDRLKALDVLAAHLGMGKKVTKPKKGSKI